MQRPQTASARPSRGDRSSYEMESRNSTAANFDPQRCRLNRLQDLSPEEKAGRRRTLWWLLRVAVLGFPAVQELPRRLVSRQSAPNSEGCWPQAKRTVFQALTATWYIGDAGEAGLAPASATHQHPGRCSIANISRSMLSGLTDRRYLHDHLGIGPPAADQARRCGGLLGAAGLAGCRSPRSPRRPQQMVGIEILQALLTWRRITRSVSLASRCGLRFAHAGRSNQAGRAWHCGPRRLICSSLFAVR